MEQLFFNKPVKMFANNTVYVIHNENESCDTSSLTDDNTNQSNIQHEIESFLSQSYPKNKTLPLVFQILVKRNLINDDLFFHNFPDIHIADFCSFLLNKFVNKNSKSNHNSSMIKLCKYIKAENIKIPKIAIKNPVANKLIT